MDAVDAVDAATRDQVLAAISSGDSDALRFLAAHVDGFAGLRDTEGMPLLHVAARAGDAGVMDLLVCLG